MVFGIYHDAFVELKDPVAVEQMIKESIPEGSFGGMLLQQYAHPKKSESRGDDGRNGRCGYRL